MKFMNMKRFGSIAMAGALALSLAAPAFAADTTTTVTGSYTDIPIAVSVPTTGTAQINPYGLPVTLTKSDDKTVDLVGQQITTKPLSIKNQGTVALDVGVSSFMVIPEGDVSIGGSANGDKQIAVTLEVASLNDATLAVSNDSEKLDDLIIDAFANDDNWAGASTLAAPTAAQGAAASAITAANANGMAVLGAVTAKSEGFTYGSNSIALFRLTGELAEEPVNGSAADPWTEDDGFSAPIVFKFTPHALVTASVRLDASTANLALNGTQVLTATYSAGETDLTVTKYTWSSDDTGVATVIAGGTATSTTTTVTNQVGSGAGAGTATITCTVTLSDGSEVTATCDVTCADS